MGVKKKDTHPYKNDGRQRLKVRLVNDPYAHRNTRSSQAKNEDWEPPPSHGLLGWVLSG